MFDSAKFSKNETRAASADLLALRQHGEPALFFAVFTTVVNGNLFIIYFCVYSVLFLLFFALPVCVEISGYR